MTLRAPRASPSRLGRLARAGARPGPAPAQEEAERCDLCADPIAPEHRHLIDLERRRLLCACRACTILFDRSAAGGGHYRLVPDRCRRIVDLSLDDVEWQAFGIPVDMAFFLRSGSSGQVAAFYPSPLGATESGLPLDAWADLESRNPVLSEIAPDVEALVVHRARGAREHWIVPVDAAYGLVGLVRTHWRGLGGGDEVWAEIAGFFERLRRRSESVTRDGEEAAWPS